MDFFWQGLKQAWQLIAAGNPELMHLVWITLLVATIPALISAVIGIPLGAVIGLGRFRGRGIALTLANLGFALPPVVVGLILALLMFPVAPLGHLQLLFTLKGVYVAQTCLDLPLVVALTVSALRSLEPALLVQAQALGASWWQRMALGLREARTGVAAALIAAVGSGLSEVGAVVLVGGNIQGYDQTLASAALEAVNAGHYAEGLAICILLIGLVLIVTAALTLLQRDQDPSLHQVRAS